MRCKYAQELGDEYKPLCNKYGITVVCDPERMECNEPLVQQIDELKKLCADIWHELDATTQYDAGGGRGVVYEFAERMRELGIEVSTC